MNNFFESKGLRVFLNCPYSGMIVPDFYYKRIPSVHSVMIEVNRSLYMDETTGRKNRSFSLVQGMLSECIKMIAEEFTAPNYPDNWEQPFKSGLYKVTSINRRANSMLCSGGILSVLGRISVRKSHSLCDNLPGA